MTRYVVRTVPNGAPAWGRQGRTLVSCHTLEEAYLASRNDPSTRIVARDAGQVDFRRLDKDELVELSGLAFRSGIPRHGEAAA